MKRRRKEVEPEPFKTVSIETFMDPIYDVRRMEGFGPSSFNGNVRVIKYRITVELVDEPTEVIQERIRKLWRLCDNHHQWGPLRKEAKRHGLELIDDERGIDLRKTVY